MIYNYIQLSNMLANLLFTNIKYKILKCGFELNWTLHSTHTADNDTNISHHIDVFVFSYINLDIICEYNTFFIKSNVSLFDDIPWFW